jgi:NAD(P)-dependent dehydrogenase (short-subunit alcohol dehydrogenase family)
MPHHLFIITGASRGLGQALAQGLLRPGHRLLCIARGTSDGLSQAAAAAGVSCEQWAADLADAPAAATRLSAWLQAQDGGAFASATLINNAALLSAPEPIDRTDPALLSAALRVGLEAPLLLSAAFLGATRPWPARRRLLNISSGLGRRAMAGAAGYCAAKAGLDNLSRAIALDEALQPNGAKVVSLAPGVIDTGMQSQLRAAGGAGFPDHEVFMQLQRSGALAAPADVAARIVAWLDGPSFGAEPLADIRDL